MDIVVEQTQTNHSRLFFRGLECRCSIGKGGVTENKVEGDLCTPAGKWPLRRVFYREDRVQQPDTAFKLVVFLKIWVGQMTLVMTEDITL